MNYLVIEGYKDAAEKFAEEAQMNIQIDLKTIEKRMNIRNAIQNGMVEEAVEMVNDLDPEVNIRHQQSTIRGKWSHHAYWGRSMSCGYWTGHSLMQ